MRESQILQLVEVKDKLVVMMGDEFDMRMVEQLRESLKRKGIEPLGVILLPNYHHVTSATKQEAIDALKEFIKKLEAM